jgi:hypothetical protein
MEGVADCPHRALLPDLRQIKHEFTAQFAAFGLSEL